MTFDEFMKGGMLAAFSVMVALLLLSGGFFYFFIDSTIHHG